MYVFCVCIVKNAHRTSNIVIRAHRPFVLSTISPHTQTNYVLQGELVDSVEHHVASSTDYIKQGHLELKQAEVYQTKARKVPEKNQNKSKLKHSFETFNF